MKSKLMYLFLTACFLPLSVQAQSPSAANEMVAAEEAVSEESSDHDVVYVIPIKGAIELALIHLLRRGIDEAEQAGADAIVFELDTPGGRLDATREIIHLLLSIPVKTYAFVEADAFSAGAIIAMATDEIFMAPGTVIGDAMPIMAAPGGGAEEMPENLQEKAVSGAAALIRTAAQEKGHDDELAECMVRREKEYKIGKEVICKEGEILTLTNQEAEREVGDKKTKRKLLSSGTVDDLDHLLLILGYKNAKVVTLEVTQAEQVARVIVTLAPVLFMLGLLGIYTEIKTPGFGVPGIVGVICLGLFFWGHNIAGLAGMEDVVIFVVGVGFLLAEVFVIPGFGVAGVIGLMLIFLALLKAMVRYVPDSPVMPAMEQFQLPVEKLSVGIILAFVGAIVIARFLPHIPFANRLVLAKATSREEGYDSGPDVQDIVGQVGKAITDLRPAGSVQMGDRRLDVVTAGEFLNKGSSVRVIDTHGNRIVVEGVDENNS